jgi:hypothetical protein
MHRLLQALNQHSHLPDNRVRVRSVLRGYARQVLPIRYGTPSISGNTCQGVYIFMVYVINITCICCCYSLYIHVLSSSLTAGLFGNHPSKSIPGKIRRKSGLRLPNKRGQQRKPALTSNHCLVYTWNMHGISSYIPGISCM